jgi:prepilin-type N-terminal cleavage/methylation domain-containing protein
VNPPASRTSGIWRAIVVHHQRGKQIGGDRGFTLVELLVTIVILPIIIGALTIAFISVFSQQTSVATRIAGSGDAQVTSANFVTDVQGAASFTTDASTSPPACGSAGSFVLGLDWTNSAGTTTVVSYWEAARGSENSLFRLACQSGSVVSSTVLSHDAPANLSLGNGLTVTCGPSTNAPLCTTQTYRLGWITTAGVLSLQLTTSEPTTKYTYILSATPRAWTPQSSGLPSGGNLPLLLLGSGTLDCADTASPGVTVNGTVVVDSPTNGAINLHDSGQLSAGTVYSASQQTPVNPYSGVTPLPTPTPATGPAIPDPWSGLPVPTGLPPHSDTQLTPLSQPGEYTAPLGVSVANMGNIDLPTGIYVFDHGLSGSAPVTIESQSGGVLIYIAGGALSISGQANFDLDPIQLPPYTGLTIWQSSSDLSPLILEGNGNASTVRGSIYAPNAVVGGTGSGHGGLVAGSIVSNGLSCSGGGHVSVNP